MDLKADLQTAGEKWSLGMAGKRERCDRETLSLHMEKSISSETPDPILSSVQSKIRKKYGEIFK